MITSGKGSNRRPTDEKKVSANWPESMGPKDGKVQAFRKVYGATKPTKIDACTPNTNTTEPQ